MQRYTHDTLGICYSGGDRGGRRVLAFSRSPLRAGNAPWLTPLDRERIGALLAAAPELRAALVACRPYIRGTPIEAHVEAALSQSDGRSALPPAA